MSNKCTISSGSNEVSGLFISIIWTVDEDINYDVIAGNNYEGSLIAITTLEGYAEVLLKNNTSINLTKNTLIILQSNTIKRYRCSGKRWKFWWIQFTIQGVIHFPLNFLMKIDIKSTHYDDFNTICSDLRKNTYLKRVTASALFLKMIYTWFSEWDGTLRKIHHEDNITKVIDMMYDCLDKNCTVEDMSAKANMSTRHFRHIFKQITGEPPKKFYDKLRCSEAGELLKLGIYSISEVAEQLGFSNPFHFSKVFKKYMKVSPSKI